MLTQIEPSPIARLPPTAGAPNSIVLETLLVFGSMRSIFPSLAHRTHTDPSPITRASGCPPTSIDLSSTFVCGSMRSTRFSAGHASHSAVSPNVSDPQSAGTRNSATTAFC